MVILITGASGFVGWNAVRHFAGSGHDVVATFYTFPHYLHQVAGCQPVPLDMADGSAIGQLVARFQPDIILHAAALARPQRLDGSSQLHTVNVTGTGHLAVAAADRDIPVIYLSTDLVYPSNAGVCNELTSVAPSGAGSYSLSKLSGEESVRTHASRWIIIRPALMYGNGTHRSNSFTQFMERNWDEGRPAPLLTDQYRSFLYVGDLISAIEQVSIHNPQCNELYVCGGPERLSRAEFGVRYAEATGRDGSACRLMRASELEGYVGGPSDISLDTAKLRATGWTPRTLEESFAQILRERVSE